MRRVTRSVFPVVVVVLLGCLTGAAQVIKGSISGQLTDARGARVSGAQLKAANPETNLEFKTSSNSSGLFRFNLLPPGAYNVEVTATGLKPAVLKGIVVAAARESSAGTVALSATAGVTLDFSETAQADRTHSQVTTVIDGAQLGGFAGVQENEGLDLMAQFTPGAVSSGSASLAPVVQAGGSAARLNFNPKNQSFSSNGLRPAGNELQIDGQNNNDNMAGGPAFPLTNSSFVRQYVMVSDNQGAEFARSSGAVVNLVTPSGTNIWHGSIYGNENNSALNSMTNFQKRFQGLSKPSRLNDEFGGFTIGGPWISDKLFFFGGADQEILSQQTVFSSAGLTPTPAGLATLAGCFPAGKSAQAVFALAKFGPYGIGGGSPTPFGKAVTNVVTACPAATFSGVQRTLPQDAHIFDFILKNDLHLDRDSLFSRYVFNSTSQFNQDDNGAAGYPFNATARNQAVLISWTHEISQRMINETRMSFGRLNMQFGDNTLGTTPTTRNLNQGLANVLFVLPGLQGFGPSENFPQGRIVNTVTGQDNWAYLMGRHQLKAGVTYANQRTFNNALADINGQFRFANWNTFFANTPNRIRIANGQSSLHFKENDFFVYFGDDWKMRDNLTINWGVSWSYSGQPANLLHDLSTTREGNAATALWNPAVPIALRTTPTIDSVKSNFAPSVGFAYSPQWGGFLTGHGKTVVRGGYRFLYDPPFYNVYLNMANSAPFSFQQTLTAQASAIPLPSAATGPNVRALLAPFLTPGTLDPRTQDQTTLPSDLKASRVQAWSLGLERELSRNSAVTVRYAGNHASDLLQSVNANPFIADLKTDFPALVANPTPCPAAQAAVPQAIGRVDCTRGVVLQRGNTGASNYNSFQAEFRANNLFKQLTVRTGYTFSKTLDNTSDIFSTQGLGNTVAFPQNPLQATKGEYSFSGLDIPHVWTVSFTEQLPFHKDQRGLIGHFVGGWSLSANYILASGQRYTPSQKFSAFASGLKNYYDTEFLSAYVNSDTARPFAGTASAPVGSVGIFAADACTVFGAACATPGTTLVSMNAINQSCGSNPALPCAVVPVTKDGVRYIMNTQTAGTVFGTPFGNVARNQATLGTSNVGNFSVRKQIRFTDRASFVFNATFLNAFNHRNFLGVDPFLEDAGFNQQGNGFGDPLLTNTAGRKVILGGKVIF
jgi:carboxypeptidase family protein